MTTRLLEERVRRGAPLVLAQGVYSGTNAAVLLIAALSLPIGELNQFALVQYGMLCLVGLFRGLLSEPMMALSRPGKILDPLPAVVRVLAGTSLITATAMAIVMEGSLWAVNAFLAAVPVLLDHLRQRAVLLQRGRTLLATDLMSLLILVGLLSTIRPDTSVEAFMVWASALAPASLVLALAVKSHSRRSGLRAILGLGAFGFAETFVGLATWFVPLVLVDLLVDQSSVGALRVSHSILGPLNVLASSLTLHALSMAGSVSSEEPHQRALRVRRLRRLVFWASCAYVGLSSIGIFLVRGSLDTTLASQLAYMFPIASLAVVIASSATGYSAVMRAMAQHRRILAVRVVIFVITLTSTGLGYLMWRLCGLDVLVVPLVVTGLASLAAWRWGFDNARPVKDASGQALP